MLPEYNESLNKRMEQASLRELMPGFDAEAEWMQLSHRLHPLQSRKQSYSWAYAAAILLLVGSAVLLKFSPFGTGTRAPALAENNVQNSTNYTVPDWRASLTPAAAPAPVSYDNGVYMAPLDSTKNYGKEPRKFKRAPYCQNTKRQPILIRTEQLLANNNSKQFFCNGTPCPLQICILQTQQCPLKPATEVATCSTLEPDQSGQLKYKVNNKKRAKHCKVTIDEITITRITTGETIVLNADSKPATASEMFSYLTGEKEGDLLTGIFQNDCDNKTGSQSLKLDNNFGSFIIE